MRVAVGAALVVSLVALSAVPAPAQDRTAERLGTVRFTTFCAPAV